MLQPVVPVRRGMVRPETEMAPRTAAPVDPLPAEMVTNRREVETVRIPVNDGETLGIGETLVGTNRILLRLLRPMTGIRRQTRMNEPPPAARVKRETAGRLKRRKRSK